MIGSLYVRGDGWLHRLPAGPKLLLLCLASLAIYLTSDLRWLGGALLLACLALWRSRAGWGHIWRQARAFLWLMLALCLFTAVFDSMARAGVVGLRVASVCLLALAVTFTTRSSELIAVIERLLAPLDRLGWVDAAKVALAISLVLRFVPEIAHQYAELREAQQARGMKAGVLSLIVPLIVRTLRRADDIADAIDARESGGARPRNEDARG